MSFCYLPFFFFCMIMKRVHKNYFSKNAMLIKKRYTLKIQSADLLTKFQPNALTCNTKTKNSITFFSQPVCDFRNEDELLSNLI